MVQRSFGSTHTKVKLDTVFNYANFYTKVLRNKPSPERPFRLHYLDAFAGTGEIPLGVSLPTLEGIIDAEEVIVGSVRRALSVDVPFSRYVFSDLRRKNTKELQTLAADYSHLKDHIEIVGRDANDVVRDFCSSLGKGDRALIFLDPFGNQVRWETLEIIAATEKVDLWYLFPAWLGIARQVKNNGQVVKEAERSIDSMFGPFDWRSHAIAKTTSSQGDFFADAPVELEKIASADGMTRFMIECMASIFGGGVAKSWLPLGRGGQPHYSLLFACSNPGKRAKELAQKVAREIMTRK